MSPLNIFLNSTPPKYPNRRLKCCRKIASLTNSHGLFGVYNCCYNHLHLSNRWKTVHPNGSQPTVWAVGSQGIFTLKHLKAAANFVFTSRLANSSGAVSEFRFRFFSCRGFPNSRDVLSAARKTAVMMTANFCFFSMLWWGALLVRCWKTNPNPLSEGFHRTYIDLSLLFPSNWTPNHWFVLYFLYGLVVATNWRVRTGPLGFPEYPEFPSLASSSD